MTTVFNELKPSWVSQCNKRGWWNLHTPVLKHQSANSNKANNTNNSNNANNANDANNANNANNAYNDYNAN